MPIASGVSVSDFWRGCEEMYAAHWLSAGERSNKMFNVTFSNGSILQTIQLPVSEIEAFIELVRKYGYEDHEGEEYSFASAQVADQEVIIFLEKKEME